MSIPPIIPLKRRVHRKRRAVVASPTPPDSIVSVAHGAGEDEIVVTVNGTVTLVDVGSALWVSADGGDTWLHPIGVNWDNPPVVLFLFPDNVSGATLWHVEDALQWTFADDQHLSPPYDGSIS